MPRTIAIGDIHGCSAALAAVLDAVAPTPADTIVTLGDYIDRGPDSRGVIAQLIKLKERCQHVALLGNHEIILRDVSEGRAPLAFWLEACGGEATLASYGGALDSIPAEHWEFLNSCRKYYETKTHIFLHANYAPALALDKQPDELLFWMHLLRIPAPHMSGKQVIVGHTPQRDCQILNAGHVVCIDTWCCGNGCLTAYDVATQAVWQADKSGVLTKSPAQ
jgi:serine/threonine protein phosphatase 1